MLRKLRLFLVPVMSLLFVSTVAAAQDDDEGATSDEPSSGASSVDEPKSRAQPTRPSTEGSSATPPEGGTATVVPPPVTEATLEKPVEDWHMEVHGYFRAPMALGISSRPNPDDPNFPNGPTRGQISYAPNRTIDGSYYSFAYTRLQEQDWAELTFHLKKKHVDAAVGWMGYWLSAAGFRNPDAAGVPGVASLTLDTDFNLGSVKPNVALQMGAWWPSFGYFEKYDTFTLGRFRQIGEQVKLKVPVNPDLALEFVEGFGTARDGVFSYAVAANSPLYASRVGADLLAYANVRLQYKKAFDLGLHWNNEWTRDPYLTQDASATDGKAYTQAADAHLSVVGAEATLSLPVAGRLWISPSYISVKNGWALGSAGGTEVMHSQGGGGIATNYMAFTNTITSSSGSGSMFNLGFLYENSLANIQGKALGTVPDVKVSLFGLLANASLDLPADTDLKQVGCVGDCPTLKSIKQIKYGADVTLQALKWFGVMLRADTVNYSSGSPGYIFSAITSRLTVTSHFLSSESIYLQYSRYIYGDKMNLAARWDWNAPLVAGSEIIQNGRYAGLKPDENVVKLQATVAF